MNSKDIRQKVLNFRPRAPAPTGIKLEDGTELFVLQPTIHDRSKVLKFAGVKAGVEDVDLARLTIGAALHLACDASGELIFEPTDADAMLTAPVGDLIEKLGTIALQKMNVSQETAAKN